MDKRYILVITNVSGDVGSPDPRIRIVLFDIQIPAFLVDAVSPKSIQAETEEMLVKKYGKELMIIKPKE